MTWTGVDNNVFHATQALIFLTWTGVDNNVCSATQALIFLTWTGVDNTCNVFLSHKP